MPLLQRVGLTTVLGIGLALAAAAGLAHGQQKNFPNKPAPTSQPSPG